MIGGARGVVASSEQAFGDHGKAGMWESWTASSWPTGCYFEELWRVHETMKIMIRYDRSLATPYEL
jgi:hypothetical protein